MKIRTALMATVIALCMTACLPPPRDGGRDGGRDHRGQHDRDDRGPGGNRDDYRDRRPDGQ
ncbi:hypothetical protein [Stenotrophomonas sp. MMGLT7]|uniref:hypothetical protein n=1 Tax=Stenotrophomonas sp. MMGLT7 TaxID=2901227 RepID=UPI001E6480AE|nr:hypothetical protein [Stenotrophomonas sp. MMGLT7]MCD7097431.1 hypothetical protein [Stenotrophomonas sp. MMGLT7]